MLPVGVREVRAVTHQEHVDRMADLDREHRARVRAIRWKAVRLVALCLIAPLVLASAYWHDRRSAAANVASRASRLRHCVDVCVWVRAHDEVAKCQWACEEFGR